jgi:predicted membrane protein
MKVIEITKTDAKISMLRRDTGSVVMLMMALTLFILTDIYPLVGFALILAYFTIGFLLVSAAIIMGVSILSKSETQALNIIDWPMKKYVLKVEGKDE